MTERARSNATPTTPSPSNELSIAAVARVEVSSEDDLFPIDRAFAPEPSLGWRAAIPGPQTIRLFFHTPQAIDSVRLHTIERASERTEQVVLSVSTAGEPTLRELCRQEFTFSPTGVTEADETLSVERDDVTVLDLRIEPDRVHAGARDDIYATLASLRLLQRPGRKP